MNPQVARVVIVCALCLWAASAIFDLLFRSFQKEGAHRPWTPAVPLLALLGVCAVGGLLAYAWIHMGRPPLRTLGETRLWYGFFLSASGVAVGWRWKSPLMLHLSTAMASIFLMVNLATPQVWNQAVMPALRSPWFVPHVAVYLLSYALLGAAFVSAAWSLVRHKSSFPMERTDTLVRVGFGFLTLGQIFGALWAKEAWGHYWAWDPKETWALLTWISFLLYLHLRHHWPLRHRLARVFLVFGFSVLLMSWFGIHSLPVAKQSVHLYSKP